MARGRLPVGTFRSDKNASEARVDQKNATATSAIRNHTANDQISSTPETSASGETQYPRIQTLWKKDTLPRSSLALTVTTADPAQMSTNTEVKIAAA